MVASLTSFVWMSPGHWPFYGRCYSEPLCVFWPIQDLVRRSSCVASLETMWGWISALLQKILRGTLLRSLCDFGKLRTSQATFLWWARCVLHIWSAKSRPLKSVSSYTCPEICCIVSRNYKQMTGNAAFRSVWSLKNIDTLCFSGSRLPSAYPWVFDFAGLQRFGTPGHFEPTVMP